MKIIECTQGSPDWWEARRGIPTASCFDRILTPKTCKLSSQADDYIDELIGDIVNLSPTWFSEKGGKPPNRAIEDGVAREAESRRWLAMEKNVDIVEVGFCLSECGRFGCSPDGLVGDDGGIELKNPMLKTQAKYLREGGLPAEYRCQVHGTLIVTGRPWWDFVSYAPPLPAVMVRVVPGVFTLALREALEEFHVRFAAAKRELGIPDANPLTGEIIEEEVQSVPF